MPLDEPIRVLHVDNDLDFVDSAATSIERADDRFDVETAPSVEEGLEYLATDSFDCVVSAYQLPEQTGIEFLETVREAPPELPFILYMGNGSADVASEAIATGVTDVLQKETDTEQYELLATRIENAVSKYRVQQLETLSEVSNDILWMFTHDWDELLYINSAYEDIWGRSTDTLAEHPQDFLNGIHPDDRDRVRTAMEQISSGETVDIEYRVNAEEDYQRWVWVQGIPITDAAGTVTRVAGFARDITERKEREREVERKNDRLEEFVSVVSHDLRNPLNVAQARVELAREQRDSEHLDSAAQAVDRGLTLIDDLLTLAREGENVSNVEAVDLVEICNECWQNIMTGDGTLVTEADRTIRADPGRLKQLFENLMRNAVEHGSEGVTVTVGELDNGFYIADDGPGIPEDEREDVFDAGYSTTDEGTGFGLSIVKQIIDAHSWAVKLTESEAGGARFEITDVETISTDE